MAKLLTVDEYWKEFTRAYDEAWDEMIEATADELEQTFNEQNSFSSKKGPYVEYKTERIGDEITVSGDTGKMSDNNKSSPGAYFDMKKALLGTGTNHAAASRVIRMRDGKYRTITQQGGPRWLILKSHLKPHGYKSGKPPSEEEAYYDEDEVEDEHISENLVNSFTSRFEV